MKSESQLEKYLTGIENCPDEEVKLQDGRKVPLLTAEYGLWDNYGLVFHLCRERVEEFFENLEDFTETRKREFNFNPGTALVSICYGQGEKGETFVYLHSYQGAFSDKPGKRMKGVSEERAIAQAFLKIGRKVLEEKLCLLELPDSQGWAHLDDDSRIVRYNPEQEEEK
jgi:hypothetical protein